MKEQNKLIAYSFLIVAILLTAVALNVVLGNEKAISLLVKKSGTVAPFLSLGFYGVLSLTPISTDPITILNVAVFGPWWGAFLSFWGNNLAALLEYILGREVGLATDFDEYKKRLPRWINRFPADSSIFLILGRLIPQFGSKIVSLSGGLYKVPMSKYVWTTAVANLIGAVIYSLAGAAITKVI